jgi:hypothetical protein
LTCAASSATDDLLSAGGRIFRDECVIPPLLGDRAAPRADEQKSVYSRIR